MSRWSEERAAPHVVPIIALLRKFTDRWKDEETLLTILQSIDTGARELWVFFDDGKPSAVMLGRFRDTPAGKKIYEICLFAGELRMSEWKLLGHIEKYAAKRGAVEMESLARMGFRKILAPHGYKPVLETLRKKLNEDSHG